MLHKVQRKPSKLKSVIVVSALIGSAALVISVKDQPWKVRLPSDDDLHENVTLSVLFTPQRRLQPVEIQAHVEGVPLFDTINRYVSPWNMVVRIPKGASVSLYARQDEAPPPGNLDCTIMTKEGVAQPSGHGYRSDEGSVRCYMNRVGG